MPGNKAVCPSKSGAGMHAALGDLFSCIGAGDVTTTKALLCSKDEEERVTLLSGTNLSGITLLQHACHTGQSEGVSMLLDQGADPSWTSTKGSTPLLFASNAGHYACVKRLLAAGVDVDAGNANGTTPLIIAAFGAHADCVRLLLEHNANPYVRDKLGRRAGDSLCGAGHHGTGGGGTAANKAFLETRALLAEARARHATKPGGGRESSAGAMDGVTESIVDDSERDEEGGSEEVLEPTAMSAEDGSPRSAAGIHFFGRIPAHAASSRRKEMPPQTAASAPLERPVPTLTGVSASATASPSRNVSPSPVASQQSPRGSCIQSPPASAIQDGRLASAAMQRSTPAEASPVPELDHPRRQNSRALELKAALAANAAMIRSMQEEERAFSAQRDLLDKRRGEAGERRKGAQEQAALLRAREGALAREKSSPSTPVVSPTTPLPNQASTEGNKAHSQSAEPSLFTLPSPLSHHHSSNVAANTASTATGNAGIRQRPVCASFCARDATAAAGTAAATASAVAGRGSGADAIASAGSSQGKLPPVPVFAVPAAIQEGVSRVTDGAKDEQSGMEDENHENQRQQEHRAQSPAQRASSSSPFRSNSNSNSTGSSRRAHRLGLDLRLQSPLRTRGRRAGDGQAGQPGVGGSSGSINAPAVRNEAHGYEEPGPEDINAEMVEADTRQGSIGGSDGSRSPVVGSDTRRDARLWRAAQADRNAAGVHLLEAKCRRVQELEAELRAVRRDNRSRENRSQRSRTNANKRQRAGTSLSSLTASQSDHDSERAGDFSDEGLQDSSPRVDASCPDEVTPALRNEVRRLRAEAAALGREHASLAAQHASLVLEKGRQAGVLRSRVATADSEVERLSRELQEAREKLQAQSQEADALRCQSEGQRGLLRSRSQDLERALNRLDNIGVALAQERSLRTGCPRRGTAGSHTSSTLNLGGDSTNMNESGSNSGDGDHNAGETAQSAPSMSVDDNNDETHRAVANQGDPRGGNRISGSNVESALESAQAVEVEERDGTRAEAVHSEAFNSAATGVLPPDVLATAAVTAATGDEISPRESGHQMARIFSHQQIDAACAGFPDSAIVGRGGFGPVFRGSFLGEDVAVKRLDGYGLQGLPNFLREVQVLTTCRHEHLVPLLGICVDPTPMLVYPFVGQSLEWHLREPQRRAAISWSTRLSVALSISKGLQYLHQPQAGAWGKPVIVHRDVKTENILMDSSLRARLSDVGIARQLDRGGSQASTRLVGTWGYIDPEYQDTGVLTPSSDVFSLGVVFLELLTGLPAHSAQLRPSSLVERVNGKQLSDCLDSSCSWPDTVAVVSFAKEAWHCVSRRGDDRPRLPHLIERMDRLDIRDLGNDEPENSENPGSHGTSNGRNTSGTDTNGRGDIERASAGIADSALDNTASGTSGIAGSADLVQEPVSQSTTQPQPEARPASQTMPSSSHSTVTASGIHPSTTSAVVAAATTAATAARAAREAAAAAAAAAVARDREAVTAAELARVAAEAAAAVQAAAPVAAEAMPESSVLMDDAEEVAAQAEQTAPSIASTPDPGRECMICASAPVQTRFLPCRHSLACLRCASLLRARGDSCPMDRARIEGIETGQFQVTYSGE